MAPLAYDIDKTILCSMGQAARAMDQICNYQQGCIVLQWNAGGNKIQQAYYNAENGIMYPLVIGSRKAICFNPKLEEGFEILDKIQGPKRIIPARKSRPLYIANKEGGVVLSQRGNPRVQWGTGSIHAIGLTMVSASIPVWDESLHHIFSTLENMPIDQPIHLTNIKTAHQRIELQSLLGEEAMQAIDDINKNYKLHTCIIERRKGWLRFFLGYTEKHDIHYAPLLIAVSQKNFPGS